MSTTEGAAVAIPETTEEIIRRSTFRLVEGAFLYVQAREVRDSERHLLVARDELETTVVTREDALSSVDVIRTNKDRWALLSIDCANPFYCVGFVSKIASFLCAEGIDLLFISTFSRDLVLVKDDERERARATLLRAGFQEAATS